MRVDGSRFSSQQPNKSGDFNLKKSLNDQECYVSFLQDRVIDNPKNNTIKEDLAEAQYTLTQLRQEFAEAQEQDKKGIFGDGVMGKALSGICQLAALPVTGALKMADFVCRYPYLTTAVLVGGSIMQTMAAPVVYAFRSNNGTVNGLPDTDGDGIPDLWEQEGYTVANGSIVPWGEGVEGCSKFTSNPSNKRTAGDPYTDLEKAMNIMPGGVSDLHQNPNVLM